MLRFFTAFTLSLMLILSQSQAYAKPEQYVIDTKGAHAFIQFKIKHLGYSWLYGRFNRFEGEFTYDADKPENSTVKVDIDMRSLDSNHAERDKHLRGKDFFAVNSYPNAKFVSKKIQMTGEDKGNIIGDLTLKGVTKEVTLDASFIGGGKDPWGGHRQGFEATTELTLADFGMTYNLGPASTTAIIFVTVEGIRKKQP